MDQPFISIVIPTLNASTSLRRCLEALSRLQGLETAEVLVVDNGSRDDTRVVAGAFPFVRLLEEPRRGAAHARNTGWRAARGRYIAFTDSDCEPDPQWLADLVPALEADKRLGAVGGTIRAARLKHPVERYIEFRNLFRAEHMILNYWFSPPFLMTANAIYRREAIEAVNGFQAELWPHEDADLAWRVQWAGWKVKQLRGKGIVLHHHRRSLKALARMMYSYGYGGADLFARHHRRLRWRSWIDFLSYWRLLKGVTKLPLLLLGGDEMMRRRGLYDTIAYSCFIAGRWRAAAKNRMLTL